MGTYRLSGYLGFFVTTILLNPPFCATSSISPINSSQQDESTTQLQATTMNLFDLPRTEEDAIRLLQERGILPNRRVCSNGHEMMLSVAKEVQWQCSKSGCKGKLGSKVKMRVGNWLAGSKIPYVTIVRFVYCWAYEYTSIKVNYQPLLFFIQEQRIRSLSLSSTSTS